MGAGTESLTADPASNADWRIVGQGALTRSAPLYDLLPLPEAYGHYYEVAGPDSDKVMAQVEFADHPSVNYAGEGAPAVDLTVLARDPDGDFREVVTGAVRLRYITDEGFIVRAAQLGSGIAQLRG